MCGAKGALESGSARGTGREKMIDSPVFPHENKTRGSGAIVAQMHAQGIGPAGARIQLRRMISQQLMQLTALAHRIPGEGIGLREWANPL